MVLTRGICQIITRREHLDLAIIFFVLMSYMFDLRLILLGEISRDARHSQGQGLIYHAKETTTYQRVAISCLLTEASISRMNNLHLVTTYIALETRCCHCIPIKA